MKPRHSDVVEALEQAEIFRFDEAAIREIEAFASSVQVSDPEFLRRRLALAAAEFALLPNIASGEVALPIRVRLDAARIATAKLNCTLFNPGCVEEQGTQRDLSSITVFSADVARILRTSDFARTEGDPAGPLSDSSELIKQAHRSAAGPRLRALAEPGGVLDLQTLLWHLQASANAEEDARAFANFTDARLAESGE